MSSIPVLSSIEDCQRLASGLKTCLPEEQIAITRHYCLTDLYWLLWFGLNRPDVEREWIFQRCREVQKHPNGYLDLWARGHYKSTIITLGLTLQDLLNDPELTFGIFSHTRPVAKAFLRQIKRELETNELLKSLFPEILWADPGKQAPKWSEDEGIVLKRRGNPKESTIEAWGLVDGQPTSKHFSRLIYDDVVTRESVTTPDMIGKTTEALSLSYNLGSDDCERRFIGTRYHFNDTYRVVLDRRTASPRLYAATDTGEADGEPVLLTKEQLRAKRNDMGPYIFSAQMMQNPTADRTQGFKREWMKHYQSSPLDAADGTNKYVLVDSANEKRKENDYTSMWCVGLGPDGNYYVLDMLRDRLNLTERADALFRMHKRWKPMQVRYEHYGMMGDVQHIQDRQNRENYRFAITEVGGTTPKNDRIKRLVPGFEQGKWYFPVSLHYTDYEKKVRDLVHEFVEEEFCAFPVPLHDDMLDSLARLMDTEGSVNGTKQDIPLVWPRLEVKTPSDRYNKYEEDQSSAWAA
jgi:predicted phage terminase large subunit-like protein